MMKTYKSRQLLSLILAAIMMLCCIPAASAAQIPEEGQPLEPDGVITNDDPIYIVSYFEGKFLWRDPANPTYISERTFGLYTYEQNKWVCTSFGTQNGHTVYAIHPENDTTVALTVNPTNKAVRLESFTSANYDKQLWYVDTTSSQYGDYLVCASSNTTIRGLRLTIIPINSSSIPGAVVHASGTYLALINSPYSFPTHLVRPPKMWLEPDETKEIDLSSVYPSAASPLLGEGKSMGYWFTYSSTNTDVATVSESGVITAHSPGTARISISHKITGIGNSFSVEVIPFSSGAYRFQNGFTGLYMTSNGLPKDDTTLCQRSLGESSWQTFYLDHLGNGYFSIEMMDATGTNRLGLYLTANEQYTDGRNIILFNEPTEDDLTANQQWALSTENGYLKVTMKGASTKVLAVKTPESGSNYDTQMIVLQTYTANTVHNDLWIISAV